MAESATPGAGAGGGTPSATFGGTRLSPVQLAACAYLGGWAGSIGDTAQHTNTSSSVISFNALATPVAIMLAESDGYCGAISAVASDGTRGYGIMQIESSHQEFGPFTAGGPWEDPITNAQDGHTIYQQAGGRYTPWSTYTNGSYLMYQTQADAGVTAFLSGSGSSPSDTPQNYALHLLSNVPEAKGGVGSISAGENARSADPLTELWSSISGLVSKLTNTHMWASVAYILAGAALLGGVLFSMIKGSKVGGAAMKIGEVAAL